MKPKNIYSIIAVLGMFTVMGWLMVASLKDETIIIDEDPHIGAGYSYLRKSDFRINPEHPPLMKDLGALPLLAMELNEPWDHSSWTDDLNGQWEFGRALIFGSGNDADAITQLVKLPMILFTLLLGVVLFAWSRRAFGLHVAFLATFLFAFSPTFLAHGRFVTTDVGAAAGFFIATIAFLRFLKDPSFSNANLAGFALGFALLTKFSTFMLFPIFGAMLLAWIWAHRPSKSSAATPFLTKSSEHSHMPFSSWYKAHAADHKHPENVRAVPFWSTAVKFAWIVIVAHLALFPLYHHHTKQYPPERQKSDTAQILETNIFGIPRAVAGLLEQYHLVPEWRQRIHDFPKNAVIWASDANPVLRAYSSYFLGLMMVFQRAVGGNTTYFMGEVNNTGFFWYFPVVYLIKEPLALHALTLIVLVFALTRLRKGSFCKTWIREHFAEFAFLFVIAFYWWASMRSILNIGVRHVLPTFPFIYILVALGIMRLYTLFLAWQNAKLNVAAPPEGTAERRSLGPASGGERREREDASPQERDDPSFGSGDTKRGVMWVRTALLWSFRIFIIALLAWQAYGIVRMHPFYLAYFNEIAGGPEDGAKWVVDSNLDWGQDLKRLARFVDANGIEEIHLDYFGWADPYYYLGEKRKWLSSCDEPRSGWIAVSASFYQGSMEKPECDYRRWLPLEKRVASIGHSIYVFRIE